MTFNSHTSFEQAFLKEIINTDASLGWRAGGRATKEFPNKEDYDWWLKHGPVMVNRWIEWRNLNPSWQLWQPSPGYHAIELDLQFELEGVLVKGFVDRVFVDGDGQLVVVDLKTGSREPEPVQLALYAIGIEKKFGVRPQWGGYWMARNGFIPQMYNLDGFTTEMVSAWFRDFRKAIDHQIFIPHLTSMCKSCGVNTSCVAYKALTQSSANI